MFLVDTICGFPQVVLRTTLGLMPKFVLNHLLSYFAASKAAEKEKDAEKEKVAEKEKDAEKEAKEKAEQEEARKRAAEKGNNVLHSFSL